jgi:hypothetical protein
MRKYLIDFLRGLETAVPPPQNAHHAITFVQYGDDENGWDERLAVHMNLGERFRILFLDEADFEHTPEELVEDCLSILISNKDVT